MNRQLVAANNRMAQAADEVNMALNTAGIVAPNRTRIEDEILKIKNSALKSIAYNLIAAIILILGFLQFMKTNTFLNLVEPTGQAKIIKNFGFILEYIIFASEYISSTLPQFYSTIALTVPTYAVTVAKNLLTKPSETINRYKTAGLGPNNMRRVGQAAATGFALNMIPGGVGKTLTKSSINTVKRALMNFSSMNTRNIRRVLAGTSIFGGAAGKETARFVQDVIHDALRTAVVSVLSIFASNVYTSTQRYSKPNIALLQNRPNNFQIVSRN